MIDQEEFYETQRQEAAKAKRLYMLYTAYRKEHGDVRDWSLETTAQYKAENAKLKAEKAA